MYYEVENVATARFFRAHRVIGELFRFIYFVLRKTSYNSYNKYKRNANHIKHFDEQESGAVWLNEDGRKVFFRAWQERKQECITHPFLNEKVSWGLVPYTQALLLARSLRGDLDDYPPFLWK